MIRLTVLAAVLVCCWGAPRSSPLVQPRLSRPLPELEGRIVGGEEILIESVPYQLSFEKFSSHICGASIISADWAVTAAHCADGAQAASVRLRAGSSTRGTGGSLHPAAQIIVHSRYDPTIVDYDIALIRVTVPFPLGESSKPIPLAEVAPVAGTPATVSGWGTVTSGGSQLPTELRGVVVPIVGASECDAAYAPLGGITARMICAAESEGGKDSCQGDSGGPLAAEGKLVGIVSWGVGCGTARFPGVYANVAVLREWIRENSSV